MKNDKFTADQLSSASMLWGASWWLEISMTTPTLVYACRLLGRVAGSPLSSSKPLCKLAQPGFGLCSNVACPISSPSRRDPRHCVATGQAKHVAAHPDRAQGSPSPKEKWKTLVVHGIFVSLGVPAPRSGGLVLELALEITQRKPIKAFSQERYPLYQISLCFSAPRTPGCNLQDWGHLRTIFLPTHSGLIRLKRNFPLGRLHLGRV